MDNQRATKNEDGVLIFDHQYRRATSKAIILNGFYDDNPRYSINILTRDTNAVAKFDVNKYEVAIV